MNTNEFINLCMRTAPDRYPHYNSNRVSAEVLHAWLGVTTECGESGDAIKKALIYGKELDLVNLDEEFADKLWYISLYCFARGITYEDLFDLVIAKLQKRFPNKFTQDEAINRDVVAERKLLEEKTFQTTITRAYIRYNDKIQPMDGEIFFYEGNKYEYKHVDGHSNWVIAE